MSDDTLTPEKRAEIDALSIGELLYDQRFAPAGDPRFVGAEGDYRMKRLQQLRSQDPAAYVAASKCLGW